MLLVDSNVLIDVFTDDPEWADWSIQQLRDQAKAHLLAINPIIYAELSMTFKTIERLDATLASLDLQWLELPKPALYLAAKAFATYRKQAGTKVNVLPDFFIGAHAAVVGMPLLTRDTQRYRTYFPTLTLIHPS
jgi:predicted nucleic acid-binding protein